MEGKVILISLPLLLSNLITSSFYKSEYYINSVFGRHSIKDNVQNRNRVNYVTKSGFSGKYRDIKCDLNLISQF